MHAALEVLRGAVKLLVPGSWSFLLVGEVVGVALLYSGSRSARWGRRWSALLLALYLLLSLQGASDLLVAGLSHGYQTLRRVEDARGADVIVVLGNGVARIE